VLDICRGESEVVDGTIELVYYGFLAFLGFSPPFG
jgi:hypothetical protein